MDDSNIPSEEVEMYKVCAMLVNEKRLKLRETLKSGFANLKDPQILWVIVGVSFSLPLFQTFLRKPVLVNFSLYLY